MTDQTITVYDANGNELAAGLQEHEAMRVAQRIANDLGESVWIDDGEAADWDEMEKIDPIEDGLS